MIQFMNAETIYNFINNILSVLLHVYYPSSSTHKIPFMVSQDI